MECEQAEFFAEHTVSELRGWKDHDLEENGRLTTPMRYDPKTDLKKPTADVTSLVTTGLAEHGLDYQSLIFSLLADRLDNLLHYRASDIPHLIAQLPRLGQAA